MAACGLVIAFLAVVIAVVLWFFCSDTNKKASHATVTSGTTVTRDATVTRETATHATVTQGSATRVSSGRAAPTRAASSKSAESTTNEKNEMTATAGTTTATSRRKSDDSKGSRRTMTRTKVTTKTTTTTEQKKTSSSPNVSFRQAQVSKSKSKEGGLSTLSTRSTQGNMTIQYAGCILYRIRESKIEFLFMQSAKPPFCWTPPKGKLTAGENEVAAATREVCAKTGLSGDDLDVNEKCNGRIKYTANGKSKSVVYFLAQCKDETFEIKPSVDMKQAKWSEETEAIKLAQHSDLQSLLQAFAKYIHSKNE